MGWEERAYHREAGGGSGGRSLRFLLPRTPLAITIIVVNVVIFLVQAFTGSVAAISPLVEWGELTFTGGRAFTQPWRWITYQYLHGSGGHLFWNMLGIYFFLPVLEGMWGWKRAFAFYTAGGVAAGVTYGVMTIWFPSGGLIGASGSELAIVGAIAVLAPDMQVLAMMVIPMTMRVIAIIYAVMFTLTIIGDRNRSDAAHLGGLAFGAVAVWIGGGVWQRQLTFWQGRRKRRARRQVVDESAAIDRILQKVHDRGMNSLTWGERRTLKKATERQRQQELARARRAR